MIHLSECVYGRAARNLIQHTREPGIEGARARSGLTRWVTLIEGTHVNIHALFQGVTSGQLPFLG